MKLSKIGRDEYQLQIDGIVYDLDLTGINACCPDTKAIYAGLKFITDDPQYYSFFSNCFGNPHSLTYFPENLTNSHYDADKQKQKIYNQARLLQGKIREYFLEAILKHCLWINNADYWTNCKFEFEGIVFPELIQKLINGESAKDLPIQIIKNETKAEKFISNIGSYGFFELPKVKTLSEHNQKELATKLSFEKIPYCIAMFEYLGFLLHLDNQYFSTNTERNKQISKWFDADNQGRMIRGNIATLSKVSEEDRNRYTAHLYKETVIKYYQQLI